MSMSEEPVNAETMRAAFRAIHESFGIITTRCKRVNALLIEYPDANPRTVAVLLLLHDQRQCTCYEESVPT